MKFVVIKKRTLLISIVSVFTAILIIVAVTVGSVQAVFSKQNRKLPVYSVETPDKKVAISFDCAWGVDYTDSLLETMREKDVKCTFFSVEFWTKKYPEYITKIDSAGHDIGTHSATHPYMSKLDKATVKKELSSSSNAITEITGKDVKVFRPPYGDYNNNLIETAEEMGIYVIQWDVDSLDWKNLTADEIYNRVVPKVQNGSIVLFHNNGLHTAEALPRIIDALKEKGFEFVKIYDMIYKTDYYIDVNGRQHQMQKN